MASRYATTADLAVLVDLSAFDSAAVDFWIEYSQDAIEIGEWGAVASQAHTFLALHYITTTGDTTGGSSSAGAGPVIAKADGPASRSYASPATTTLDAEDADLMRSVYGRRYLELRARLAPQWGAALARNTSRWPR